MKQSKCGKAWDLRWSQDLAAQAKAAANAVKGASVKATSTSSQAVTIRISEMELPWEDEFRELP